MMLLYLVLQKGADPNLKNSKGVTSLDYAIQEEFSDKIIQKMIEHIPDVNIKFSDGSTPFFWALRNSFAKRIHRKSA